MATPQSILTAAQCAVCPQPGLTDMLEIGLLKNILTTLGATMTAEQINAAAACFTCFGVDLASAQKLVLLDQISQNISGGGGGTIQVYTGAAPPAAPDDPTKPALYYPTGGGTLFQWDGAAWV